MDFAALYDQYSPLVSNLTFKLLGDYSQCEDATQETFLQVYRHLSGFRGDAAVSTWIYRIAVNVCLQSLPAALAAYYRA